MIQESMHPRDTEIMERKEVRRTLFSNLLRVLRVSVVIFLIMAAFSSPLRAGQETGSELQKKINEVVALVKPAVVRIRVVSTECEDGRERKEEITGSGVIISKEGYVITNHHVAGQARQIFCTLADKEELEAEQVGTDPLTDICVIKLLADKEREFPAAKLGDSSKIQVGSYCLAMGSPLALSQSVTLGVISNTELVFPELFWPFKFTVEGEEVGSMVAWIGHDANIDYGSSGGPLVNLDGEIIGINELYLGLGAAIPSNLAKEIAQKLINYGDIERSWLGLEIQPLLKSSKINRGVLINNVIGGSPAQDSGFMSGDILLELAGSPVTIQFPEQLSNFNHLLTNLPVGEEVEAVVWRNGEKLHLKVIPKRREKAEGRTVELKGWGMCAQDLTALSAKRMDREEKEGVLVVNTRPGGPVDKAQPPLEGNDIIKRVEGRSVENIRDLQRLTDEIILQAKGPVSVKVNFWRGKEEYLTVVKLNKEEAEHLVREAKKAWLPVATQVLTSEMAKALGLGEQTGVRITQVYPQSSAEEAGLKMGDIIIALDGEPIPASWPEDTDVFPTMVRQRRIGSKVELTLWRDGKEMKLKVELVSSSKSASEMESYYDDNLEFSARDVVFTDQLKPGWQEGRGVVIIKSVNEGGWAALAQLAVGDMLLSVDGKGTENIEELKKIMESVAVKKLERVVFEVQRGIHHLYLELEPKWEE